MAEGRTTSGLAVDAFFGKAPRGVFGGEQLAHVPRRVAQRRRHRVPAVHDHRRGRLAAQAVAAGALEALAPLGLLARGAGLWRRNGAGWGVAVRASRLPYPIRRNRNSLH